MGLPDQPQTLQPDQVNQLNQKLSVLRHNVNNHLSLIVAACELLKRKPDLVARMVDSLLEQPQKIVDELRQFSEEFERILQISRD